MRPLFLTAALATFEQTAYQYDGRETRIACLGIHREDRLTAFADPRDVASSGGAVTTGRTLELEVFLDEDIRKPHLL